MNGTYNAAASSLHSRSLWFAVVLVVAFVGCNVSENTAPKNSDSELSDRSSAECGNEQRCPSPEACLLGECKLGVKDCRVSAVECGDAPPACAPGSAPAVGNGCWTGCVAAELCAAIDDCSPCDDAGKLCVELPRNFGTFFVCSEADLSECNPVACSCLGEVCGGELVCEGVNDDIVKCTQDNTQNGAAGSQASYD